MYLNLRISEGTVVPRIGKTCIANNDMSRSLLSQVSALTFAGRLTREWSGHWHSRDVATQLLQLCNAFQAEAIFSPCLVYLLMKGS